MKFNTSRKTLVVAVGMAVTALSPVALAEDASSNPFAVTELSGGYMQLAEAEGAAKAEAEGSCGEGKCGDDKAEGDDKAKAEGSCGEGKCGDDKAEGDDKAKAEGSCGEGKCGDDKAEGDEEAEGDS